MATYTVEELHTRVTEHEPGIIILREVSAGNKETWRALVDRAKELRGSHRPWGVVIDLSDVAVRPDADYREALKGKMQTTSADHVAFVQPDHVVLREALRFVLTTFSGVNTVHKDMNEALAAIRKTLGRGTRGQS